jgi:hypothetical protein
MGENKNQIAAILAIMATILFSLVIGFLCFQPVPAANKDFFNTALIALIGLAGTSFGFYLGSSYGSAAKNGLIAAQTKELSALPPIEAGGKEGES